MASALRLERINVLLREVVANTIERELQFPEDILVTVTRTQLSEDVHYATIFISVLGGGATSESDAIVELNRTIGSIQHEVNRKLRMRPVPRISFAIDSEEKRRERVEELLARDAPTIEK